MLTNSYFPSSNIEAEEFINFKFQYLIKKKDPLILPPDYDKLPLPDSKSSDNREQNRIETILNEEESSSKNKRKK